ncbi:MAG: methyl-accepting chemotaxis protein, partial [Firmicutes bacterium]|nr:methyl-accepting chemotaxis protein [Bacillota bacterium]
VIMQAAAARAYMVYGNEKFVNDFNTYADKNLVLLRNLQQEARRQENKEWAKKLLDLNQQYADFAHNTVFPLVAAGKSREAATVAAVEGLPIYQGLTAAAQEYYEKRHNEIGDISKLALATGRATRDSIVTLGLLALLIGIVISVLLARAITKPVAMITARARQMAEGDLSTQIGIKSGDEIGMLAQAFNQMVENLRLLVGRIAESGNNLAAHSEELSASAQEVSANMQDIAGTTAAVAATAEEGAASSATAVEMAGKVLQAAEEGNKAVRETVAKMNSIKLSVDNSAATIKELGERSKQIGQIIDIINGIADQTNLLALNAAIEAARAGEQGRGFAVVAEEVRKLAEKSAASTKEIASIIAQIQKDTGNAVAGMEKGAAEVNEGVLIVDRAGHSLKNILDAINRSVEVIRQIDAGVGESSRGSQRLAESADQVAATVDQIAGAAQSLAKMAQSLQEDVARFKL